MSETSWSIEGAQTSCLTTSLPAFTYTFGHRYFNSLQEKLAKLEHEQGKSAREALASKTAREEGLERDSNADRKYCARISDNHPCRGPNHLHSEESLQAYKNLIKLTYLNTAESDEGSSDLNTLTNPLATGPSVFITSNSGRKCKFALLFSRSLVHVAERCQFTLECRQTGPSRDAFWP